MRTISYKLDDLKKVVIPIGYEGENNHTRVIIDAGEVFKQYPAAVATLKVKPPHGTIYPVVVRREGDTVIWDVKETDCASNGTGEAQFTFTENSVIVKNDVTKININRSLVATGPAPDPIEDWLDEATEVLDDLGAMDNIAKNAKASDIGKSLSPKTVVDGVVTEWQYVEQSGGTEDYTDLDNKPSIAGVTLSGNKTLEDLGIAAADDLDNLADDVTDVKNAIQGLDDDKYEKPSGGIPATDLTQAVQNSLSAADSAYQKPSGGIPASDIADGVIPVVDSALSDSSENAVQNKVVKGALDGKAPVIINTATGNPAVFSDGADGLPIQSLKVHLLPQQEGTGDPSPQNIRSILPWNGLKVWNGGKNLFKLVESEMVSVGWNRFFPNPIKKAGTYTISCQHPFGGTGNQGARVVLTNDDDSSAQEIKLLTAWTFGQSSAGSKATFTLTEEEAQCEYIWFQCAGANTGFNQFENAELQIEVGQTPTAYEPYKPITETDISFPSPVYGGEHEAVSGKLMDGWAKVEIKNCYYIGTWDGSKGAYWYITLGVDVVAPKKKAGSGLGMCESLLPVSNVSTEETRDVIAIFDNNIVKWIDTEHMTLTRQEYREYLANNPIVICYQIATPTEQTLTGHQITALVGKNTIWSDADGSMTIEYPADTKTYINNLIATAIASL